MVRRISDRLGLRDERGQGASEYMGMLLLVAVVIGALLGTGLPGAIADAASGMVDKVAGGNETGRGHDPAAGRRHQPRRRERQRARRRER